MTQPCAFFVVIRCRICDIFSAFCLIKRETIPRKTGYGIEKYCSIWYQSSKFTSISLFEVRRSMNRFAV